MTVNGVPMTAGDILTHMQGELLRGSRDRSFSGISTDSRTVEEGELFWALKGDIFDGHDVTELIQRKTGYFHRLDPLT